MQAATPIDYKVLYEQAQAQLEQALSTIALLQHRIEQLEKIAFGSKQERFVHSSSPIPLAAEKPDAVATSTTGEAKQITYSRTTKVAVQKEPLVHPGRGKLPDHLRREDIVLEPTFIPQGSIKIGELVKEQLEYKPGELYLTSVLSMCCLDIPHHTDYSA